MSNPVRKRVYVAAPYSKGDCAVNIRAAIDAADSLFRAGFAPFVPHTMTHMWHMVYPMPHADWMALDLAFLSVCHCLLRLPGESAGADQEVKWAGELGISVYHTIEALIAGEGGK